MSRRCSVVALAAAGVALLLPAAASAGGIRNTVRPSVVGDPVDGQTLTANPGTWSGGKNAIFTYTYTWYRCQGLGKNCSEVKTVTTQTYLLTGADIGYSLVVRVRATTGKDSAEALSPPTQPVSGAPPTSTELPTISGVAQSGQILTASRGTWNGSSPISYSYRWRRCDTTGSFCSDLFALDPTYTVALADVGWTLRVAVSATNVAGTVSATSAPTRIVIVSGATCSDAVAPTGGATEICLAQFPSAPIGNDANETATFSVTISATSTGASDTFGCPGQRFEASHSVPCVTWQMDGNYVLTDLWPPYTMTLHAGFYPSGQHVMTGTTNVNGVDALVTVPLTITGNGIAAIPASPNSGLIPNIVPHDPDAIVVGTVGDGAASQGNSLGVTGRIASWNPDLLFYLGDVYQIGSYEEYLNFYGSQQYYGQFDSIAVQTPGNHEYQHVRVGEPAFADALGYYWFTNYLNGPPSEPGRGANYFSFDLPNGWHVIDLNSEIPLTATSAQVAWLKQDLAAHPDSQYPCTIAIWHRPRLSTSAVRGDGSLQPLWDALVPAGVDIILNGHAHVYERSVPLNRDATVNASGRGVVQFVVGTGGNGSNPWGAQPSGWVAYRANIFSGALRLVLEPTQAQFQFQRGSNGVVYDSGAVPCRTGDVAPPTVPRTPTAVASAGQVQLSWGAATDNVGVTGYQVFRDGALLSTTAGATTYTDTTVVPGTAYVYKMRATDAAGNESLFSAAVTVTAA